MITKYHTKTEFYLYMNGKLILKYWKQTGTIRVFDKLGDTVIKNIDNGK